ncbi:unnamed protein product [Eruca vesicaria subsp. sativa]|uniref:Uncharacterized protein n=1 Tax=Eruca vesicaria subsp. sativa TaxID=29727 RepID=A0ABC8M2E5_ERUVS|nr:unnamed protein product [Eruca vesicaria subsp. sativa]
MARVTTPMSSLIVRLMASVTIPPMSPSVAKAPLLAGICLHVLLSTVLPMTELIGKEEGKGTSRIRFEQLLVSMRHQSCGALTLWNYPNWMRNLVAQDIDGEDRLGCLGKDRERGVPRYNEFRKNLLMSPISNWEDLTDDEEAIKVLKEVYGGVIDKLDLSVELHAEKKIKEFPISETAFFIIFLVTYRRLEAVADVQPTSVGHLPI